MWPLDDHSVGRPPNRAAPVDLVLEGVAKSSVEAMRSGLRLRRHGEGVLEVGVGGRPTRPKAAHERVFEVRSDLGTAGLESDRSRKRVGMRA
jgi:hypothetical protein